MTTNTPNTSITTFGDITSDQNHLWPSFAVSDDENDLDRLRAQRNAIDAKIAELERRQMIRAETEATPKAKAIFVAAVEEENDGNENESFGTSLILKMDELSKKFNQMERELFAIKQKEEGKLSRKEAENILLERFAEIGKKFDQMEDKLNDVRQKEKDKFSQIEAEKKNLMAKFTEMCKKFDQMEANLKDVKQKDVEKLSQIETETKGLLEIFSKMSKKVDQLEKESDGKMRQTEQEKLSKTETEKNEVIKKCTDLEKSVLELKEGQKDGPNEANNSSRNEIAVANEGQSEEENDKKTAQITEKENEKREEEKETTEANAKGKGTTDAEDTPAADEVSEKDRLFVLHRKSTLGRRHAAAWWIFLRHPHTPPSVEKVEQLGRLIFCGWGKTAPADVRDAIHAKYGLKYVPGKSKLIEPAATDRAEECHDETHTRTD